MSIELAKSLHVPTAEPDTVLGLLQDPLFWSMLPCTFRRLDLNARPFSLGSAFKPALEEYRMSGLTANSVSFRAKEFGFAFEALPDGLEGSKLQLTFSVDHPT